MSHQTAARPAGCIVLLTPERADLVYRALCSFLVTHAKPHERAELADLVDLLAAGECYERGAL